MTCVRLCLCLFLFLPLSSLADDCPASHSLPPRDQAPERAQLVHGEQQLRADRITYDKDSDRVQALGDVQLWYRGLFVSSVRAELAPQAGEARFFDAEYISEAMQARGRAEQAELIFGVRSLLQQADFTSCTQQQPTWVLQAERITLNHQRERGAARHAVLRIRNVPVLYSPWWSFPISKARQSGFLAPDIGSSPRYGLELEVPWYWNIAPNRDATLRPRWLSDGGVLWQGQYRWLSQAARGNIKAGWLPADRQRSNDRRALFSLRHAQGFAGGRGQASIDFNWLSDREYLNDFGHRLSLSSIHYLDRVLDVRHAGGLRAGGRYALGLRLQDYQALSTAIRPYQRLPQLWLDYHSAPRDRQLNFQLGSELVRFAREHPDVAPDIDGLRFDLYPQLHYPIYGNSGFLRPKIGLRYTQYRLWEASRSRPFTTSPSRLAPVLSVDGGLFFERRREGGLQTLEPRVFYLYVPAVRQQHLPIFDSAEHSFRYDALFYENRFAGRDRLGDAHQITLSVRSALFRGNSTRQLGAFQLGQIIHLRDRRVVLPGGRPERESTSPLLLEGQLWPAEAWQASALGQWNPHGGHAWERVSLRLGYRPAANRLVNLAYRKNRDDADLEQTDLSLLWPLAARWGAVARWNYSLPTGNSLDAFAGLEYQGCCLSARVLVRRFLLREDDYETGLFLHLQLKGLGGFGEQTVEFLRANMPGYVQRF